ncbi:hypothetical protein EDB19DRAFT_2028005 [Suillus lakei]|nr:hypothetical protein EDB19DRAFT_2028005 [Suillus lakei]
MTQLLHTSWRKALYSKYRVLPMTCGVSIMQDWNVNFVSQSVEGMIRECTVIGQMKLQETSCWQAEGWGASSLLHLGPNDFEDFHQYTGVRMSDSASDAYITPRFFRSLTFTQRNYHAPKKKRNAKPARPPNASQPPPPPPSSQKSAATTTESDALPAVATTALATGTSSHTDITIKQAGWWTRFLLWIGGVSVQYTDSQH